MSSSNLFNKLSKQSKNRHLFDEELSKSNLRQATTLSQILKMNLILQARDMRSNVIAIFDKEWLLKEFGADTDLKDIKFKNKETNNQQIEILPVSNTTKTTPETYSLFEPIHTKETE